MKHLYVGPTNNSLSIYAKERHPNAVLITKDINLDNVKNGYVSLGDFDDIYNFKITIEKFDIIEFVDSGWSAEDYQERTTVLEHLYQYKLLDTKKIIGLDLSDDDILPKLVDIRTSNNSQLWVVGCSITEGVGVSKDQRWGHLLSKQLTMPVSYLALSGTSVSWAVDQIIRSDIRKDDIVCWLLTGVNRHHMYYDNHWHQLTGTEWPDNPELKMLINKNILVSDHAVAHACSQIEHAVRYLRSVGCKFILSTAPLNIIEHRMRLYKYLSNNVPEFTLSSDNNGIEGPKSYIDLGSDSEHPGPKQHKLYADLFLKSIKK